MNHRNTVCAIFKERINRFVARVQLDGKDEIVHVKNTGRLKELLFDGATVCLEKSDNPSRKTAYDLVAVEKITPYGKTIVSIDSQAANAIALEWLGNTRFFGENAEIKREVTYKKSRFDFYIETTSGRKIFLEVKGCTLEKDGTALFPDAPTERGVKHLNELCVCIDEGYEAYVLFVIQMKGVHRFCPNAQTHPDFAKALARAKWHGVKILAVDCIVTKDSVTADSFVETVI